MIDWDHFTPLQSLAGGALIGLAAALLMLIHGRVAGISGILGGLMQPGAGWRAGRICFTGGLLIAPGAVALFGGHVHAVVDASWPALLAGGLLVGFGTRLGSGCTSGHGVCGIARGSVRSLTATAIFMLTAAATVYAARHLAGG